MEHIFLEVLPTIFTGVFIGFCIGMTGVGGGAMVVPILTLGFGMTPSISVGTASLYTFLTKILATYFHRSFKTISYRISLIFLSGAIPTNIIASWYINNQATSGLNESIKVQFQEDLKFFIAIVMLVSSIILFLDFLITKNQVNTTSSKPRKNFLSASKKNSTLKIFMTVLLSLFVGIVIGATALGAGVLTIPILLLFFRMGTNQAVGSSIFIGLILTLISSLIYGKGGQIQIVTALLMGLGSIGGVYYGSKAAITLSEPKLKLIVIGIISIASGLMFM